MSANKIKNLLFVFDKPPHSSPATKEGLDAVLTASAFGQNVTLLLIGDGIYQLLNNQDPSHLPAKNTASIFQALEIYGIENIVTPSENLKTRDFQSLIFLFRATLSTTSSLRNCMRHKIKYSHFSGITQ